MTSPVRRKPLNFMGSSREDLREFPKEVRIVIGTALNSAQLGGKHPAARPMKGFHGAGVLEIVDDFDGDTYRAIYTVKFEDIVYVLHAFQKKSKKGIETPKKGNRPREAALQACGRKLQNVTKEQAMISLNTFGIAFWSFSS